VNEQIQQHLDAEAESDSRGYITDRPFRCGTATKDFFGFGLPPMQAQILDGGGLTAAGDPARLPTPDAVVAVRPLAGVTQLLELLRPEAANAAPRRTEVGSATDRCSR
jgi:hypothetical protein